MYMGCIETIYLDKVVDLCAQLDPFVIITIYITARNRKQVPNISIQLLQNH